MTGGHIEPSTTSWAYRAQHYLVSLDCNLDMSFFKRQGGHGKSRQPGPQACKTSTSGVASQVHAVPLHILSYIATVRRPRVVWRKHRIINSLTRILWTRDERLKSAAALQRLGEEGRSNYSARVRVLVSIKEFSATPS
jgi:hypothetical protein